MAQKRQARLSPFWTLLVISVCATKLEAGLRETTTQWKKIQEQAETEKSEEKWHVVERSYGRYERALQVPAGIDPEAVKAGFKDGVLSVTLPKPPQAEPKARKISVSHG